MSRIGIYLRVSTTDQSTELQRREIEEYCLGRGWLKVEVYEDHGLSGTNGNRPELKRLLQDVSRRKLDVVLIWKLDRLFRSLKDLVNTLQTFEDCKVSLISLKETIDLTSSSGRLLMQMIGAFAEFEASLIRERVRAGLRNAKAKGRILGRPVKRDDVKIKALKDRGFSLRQIASELKTSMGSVQRGLRVTHVVGNE